MYVYYIHDVTTGCVTMYTRPTSSHFANNFQLEIQIRRKKLFCSNLFFDHHSSTNVGTGLDNTPVVLCAKFVSDIFKTKYPSNLNYERKLWSSRTPNVAKGLGSGNGLLLGGTKPLPEPMSTYHSKVPCNSTKSIIIRSPDDIDPQNMLENCIFIIASRSSGDQ